MRREDYSNYSNAELTIKLKEYENEYETAKQVVKEKLIKMDELDKKYLKVKTILEKRTKGKV